MLTHPLQLINIELKEGRGGTEGGGKKRRGGKLATDLDWLSEWVSKLKRLNIRANGKGRREKNNYSSVTKNCIDSLGGHWTHWTQVWFYKEKTSFFLQKEEGILNPPRLFKCNSINCQALYFQTVKNRKLFKIIWVLRFSTLQSTFVILLNFGEGGEKQNSRLKLSFPRSSFFLI